MAPWLSEQMIVCVCRMPYDTYALLFSLRVSAILVRPRFGFNDAPHLHDADDSQHEGTDYIILCICVVSVSFSVVYIRSCVVILALALPNLLRVCHSACALLV